MRQNIDLNKVIRRESDPPACDDTLGIKVLEANSGYAKCLWTIDDRLLNGNGVVMGGFVSAAADVTMAYAISTLLNEGQTFASIDLDTTFHRPILSGDVEIEATVEKFGNTISYVTSVLTQNKKRIANAVSSIMVMQKK
ncbi:PaaI family thioesterase [Bacillus sp. S/N-304-OC-R1]|uniref:PaaI family thioesterase n=1 Tax=Bacillus sp. S/N-304-OC-R1 TaxID=2758034 RepID=UPI001C8DEE05|nr:PaaI family thioesterase [Bacillus sp. S/N-304-OC-R1]MBY0121797.1 PaaI family thioesterase [Bacillus sp. S/N-304-OC-R1]